MDFCKKVMMLIFIGVMAFAFSACGDKAVTPTGEPEETITKVLANLEEVKSMKSTITTQADMTTAGSTSSVATETEVTAVYSPLNMKIESKNTSSSNNVVVTYVEETDGVATTYMEYAGQWMKQSSEPNIILDSLRMYDSKQNAILFLKNAANWQETDGDDSLGVFQGTLPANILYELVEDTKSLQVMGMAGLTQEYYEGVSDAAITVTIDKQNNLLMDYTVDLSNTLETLMNNVVNTFSSGTEEDELAKTIVNQYTLAVKCSDINSTKKVEIPKETLNSAVDFERQIENAVIVETPKGENGEDLAVE